MLFLDKTTPIDLCIYYKHKVLNAKISQETLYKHFLVKWWIYPFAYNLHNFTPCHVSYSWYQSMPTKYFLCSWKKLYDTIKITWPKHFSSWINTELIVHTVHIKYLSISKTAFVLEIIRIHLVEFLDWINLTFTIILSNF